MKKNKIIRTASLALIAILGISTAACSNNKSDSEKSSSSSKSSKKSSATSKAEKTVNETKTKVKTAQIKISQTKALNIFDKDYSDKKITDIDLKPENNKYIYEIEGVDSKKEYSMTIDAHSGEVLHKHSETLDLDERINQGIDFDKVISRNEASDLAEKHVGSGTSKEWKLEQDHTKTYWEVKVDDGNKQTEVKIDAKTKKIIDTEHDDD